MFAAFYEQACNYYKYPARGILMGIKTFYLCGYH